MSKLIKKINNSRESKNSFVDDELLRPQRMRYKTWFGIIVCIGILVILLLICSGILISFLLAKYWWQHLLAWLPCLLFSCLYLYILKRREERDGEKLPEGCISKNEFEPINDEHVEQELHNEDDEIDEEFSYPERAQFNYPKNVNFEKKQTQKTRLLMDDNNSNISELDMYSDTSITEIEDAQLNEL